MTDARLITGDARVVLAESGQDLLACCELQLQGEAAYFGMFSVRPEQQGNGIGHRLLAEAERIAGQRCDFVSRSVAPPAVAAFGEAAMEAARPIDDHRSTAQYRRHAVRVMAERLLRRAFPHG